MRPNLCTSYVNTTQKVLLGSLLRLICRVPV